MNVSMDPSTTRVAVIGGGPGGLCAAAGLLKLGYKHVTVLEQNETVGGMCASLVVDDRVYDLGGQVLARESCPTVMSMVRAFDLQVEMEDMSQHQQAIIDLNTGRYKDLNVGRDYVALMAKTFELQAKAKATGKLGIHAVSSFAHERTPVFMRKNGLSSDLPGAIANLYTASGYGFVEDVPYAYVHEFICTSMLGKLWRVKGGYRSLWNKVAQNLPDVRCNVKVRSIDRSSNDVVRISVVQSSTSLQETVLEFDKVILTGSLPIPKRNRTYRSALSSHDDQGEQNPREAEDVLDFSDEEQQLFSKVQTMEYYTTAVTISGLDVPPGFYLPESAIDSSTMGHIVGLQRFFGDTNVYIIWSYGNAQCDQQRVTELLHDDVRRMGGRVESVLLQRKWVYCPHVNSQEMADGFYDKLDNLQGERNTYYLGALLAFELTERNSSFALNLVRRFFGPSGNHSIFDKTFTGPIQRRPVIQNLIPAPLDEHEAAAKYTTKKLTEMPGLSFPELPSIDAYVSYYGRHEVHRDRIAHRWVNDKREETDSLTFGELDSRVSIIAHRLLTGDAALKPGDRVLMVYPPGLEFIEAFFGCLRARVLPVPVIPPDPTKPYDQALIKVASVTKASDAKAILSTASYHNVVRAFGWRSTVFGQKAPPAKIIAAVGPPPQWPDLPWHHTDSWTRGSIKELGLLAWATSKANNGPAKKETSVENNNFSMDDSIEMKARMRNDPKIEKRSSSILDAHDKSTEFDELVAGNCAGSEPKPSDLCFLQFTSGSTGDPKGVMITHGGLLHNVNYMKRLYNCTSRTVGIQWLPQYHDMGLIGGILATLFYGGCLVLFSPATFIRKPLLWLELIERYKGTHIAAPNFAFELLLKRYESSRSKPAAPGKEHKHYDLSSLHFIMSGAEPIRPGTTRRFLELFYNSGLRESMLAMGYGLAESCVFVSTSYGKSKPLLVDGDGRLCVGYTSHGDPDMDVRIVNTETFEEQNEGMEGELWVCSPSNGVGYWGLEELSKQTFANEISKSSDGKKFLRTGDLGRVINGHIFVTGRAKDLIIIQGRNIYPSDIEKTVESCSEDVRPGCSAAISVPQKILKSKGVPQYQNSREEDDEILDACVVVVAEVRDEKNLDANIELASRIKSAVASEHGINVAYVDLIKPRSIPKTSSGKIRRGECLKRFSEGTLLSIGLPDFHLGSERAQRNRLKNDIISRKKSRSYHNSPCSCQDALKPDIQPIGNKEELMEFLVGLVAKKTKLSVTEVSVKEGLSNYSLTSLETVSMAQEISEYLGVHIAPLELYTASCIEELADNCLAFLHNAGLKLGPNTETSNYVDNNSKHSSHPPNPQEINENFETELICDKELMSAIEPSVSQQFLVTGLQVLGLLFIAALLLIPAATIYGHVLSFLSAHQENSRLTSTFLAIALVPAAWMVYIGVVGVTICLIVKILRPNYAVQSAIPLWSARYVRWWTLCRLQDFASKSLAVHLRGTVFLVWWYRLMGAQIGNNVHIDTTEITDPSLLYIGNGTVVEEDATLQSHDVRAGAVHFQPIRIGSRCVVGSFSVVQIGTQMGAGSRIGTLCKSNPGQHLRSRKQSNSRVDSMEGLPRTQDILRQLCGVYLQGLISTISALLAYAAFRSLRPTFLSSGVEESSEIQAFEAETSLLFTLALTFPWALSIVAPITLLSRHDPAQIFQILINLDSQLPALLLSFGASFVVYGIVLGALTSVMKWCLISNPRSRRDGTDHQLPIERIQSTTLIVHGLLRSAHQKFFVLLAGTEALCIYLRNLGAQIGSSVSIRKVNALIDPDFLSLGDGCHLGDFSRIVTTKITRSDETNAMLMTSNVVHVGSKCVVGAQSVVLPGTTMENESVLGAMSVVPDAMLLQEGGVYVGGREGNATVMISRQTNSVDLRVEGMDRIYRQIVAKLATRIAKTTITSTDNGRRVRFFHRAGVAGRGTLRVFDDLPDLPKVHGLFSPGHSYPVVVRHSNALSGSDDRCPDAKGAALRILDPNSPEDVDLALLDLVMNTGKCLHARNMLELMSWDTKSRKAQEEYVQENPRIGEILWGSIRAADSYAEVHYYSVLARLFRSNLKSSERSGSKPRSATEDSDCFLKFRLRPSDSKFDASHGSVIASAALPPQQGYLPASPGDKRSTEYLREEFKLRLQTKEGAKYILQLQKHRIPESTEEVNDVLDPTVAWDEDECPFVDVAELSLNTLIADEVAEKMTFNSRNGGPGVAVVPATSATDSASIDHCRSVVYDIAQTIRKGLPLPGAWKDLVRVENLDLNTEKFHGKVDHEKTGPAAAGCPMMSPLLRAQSLNQAEDRNDTLSTPGLEMAFMKLLQPLLQATVPIMLLVLSAYPIVVAMAYLASKAGQKRWMAIFPFMIPVAYVAAGVTFALTSVCCRWVLLGRYQGEESNELWSWQTLCFTVWEALMEVLKGTFLELVKGSLLYNVFLRLLGASIGRGVYTDSLNVLNPEQLRIGAGSAVGRNAIFFGHLYEPGRKVFYKSNVVGDFCTIGTQALMLPGSQLDDGSELDALELGMKDEVIASYQ